MRLLLASLLLLGPGCKSETSEKKKPTPPAKSDEGDKPAAEKKAPPPPKLLETATERRLHVDRAEASSFLWNDWNRFQENYHPLYLVDDDPKTAWVEGADGSGVGEWIRLHVTEVDEATAVKLRLKNGYHKSKSLFAKNARASKLSVKLLPSGTEKTFDLDDSMKVATLELEQPAGKLAGLELRVVEVYEGSKYADLCLSDVEIHVSSRTPENPAFEKAKLDRVKGWKKERLAAAELFASAAGKSVPVGTSYRVVDSKAVGPIDRQTDPLVAAAELAAAAVGHLEGHAEILERARAGLESKFAGWKPASAAIKKGREVPAIDGLHVPEMWELFGGAGVRDDSYSLPLPGMLEFLTSSRISLFESTEDIEVAEALAGEPGPCRRGGDGATKHYYYQPPESGSAGVTREILVIQCGMVEERDGFYSYVAFQLLEYDDTGKIAAIIEPEAVTTFSWTEAGDRLGEGRRIRRRSSKLITDRLIARK